VEYTSKKEISSNIRKIIEKETPYQT